MNKDQAFSGGILIGFIFLSRVNNIVLLFLLFSDKFPGLTVFIILCKPNRCCYNTLFHPHMYYMLTLLLGKFGELEMPKGVLVVTSVGARVLLVIEF